MLKKGLFETSYKNKLVEYQMNLVWSFYGDKYIDFLKTKENRGPVDKPYGFISFKFSEF